MHGGKHVSTSPASCIENSGIVCFWTAFKAACAHCFQVVARSGDAGLLACAVDEGCQEPSTRSANLHIVANTDGERRWKEYVFPAFCNFH